MMHETYLPLFTQGRQLLHHMHIYPTVMPFCMHMASRAITEAHQPTRLFDSHHTRALLDVADGFSSKARLLLLDLPDPSLLSTRCYVNRFEPARPIETPTNGDEAPPRCIRPPSMPPPSGGVADIPPTLPLPLPPCCSLCTLNGESHAELQALFAMGPHPPL